MATSYKPRIKLNFLILWVGVALLTALVYFSYLDERKNAELEFQKSEFEATNLNSLKVQEKLEVIYRELRTIARLPSVKSLNLQNRQLSADTKTTIQEIYNNIFDSFNISELYIVPVAFDPNLPTSKKSSNVPLITFDEFITQRKGDENNSAPNSASTLVEEESYEYQLMKTQIDYFKKEFNSLAKIKDLDYPIISGAPVITCDNSKMNGSAPNDEDRKGLVFSVPFYDHNDQLAGMISGVILTSKIRQLLSSSAFELTNNSYAFKIHKEVNYQESNLPVIHSIELSLHDPIGKWSLSTRQSPEAFLKSRSYLQVQQKYFLVLLVLGILSLGLFVYVSNSSRLQQWREKKNLELTEKLELKTKELEESAHLLIQTAKLSTLGEMATGIAHEVSNPLAVINSKAERILHLLNSRKDASHSPANDQEVCNEIAKSAQKIVDMVTKTTKIVKGLRTFARQGENDPLEPYSIAQLVQESIELTEHKLKSIHAELKVSEIPELQIACRSTQIDQVIVNLINNAVDAIEHRSEPWIRLDVDSNDDYVFIRITDCGPGISKEIQDKILNPFFTTKEAGKGTGVGLSISRTIMKEHRGSLSYNPNCPNTQFVLSFPILKAKAA